MTQPLVKPIIDNESHFHLSKVSQYPMELILVFIMLRKMVVTEGHADQVVEKFSKKGPIEQQEGFIDLTVMKQKARRGEEAVVVMIRWESEAHWKQWEKSDAHLAGHRANRGKPKPDFLISTEVNTYEVQAVKNRR